MSSLDNILTQYQWDQLSDLQISQINRDWITFELIALKIQLDNPPDSDWTWRTADELHTLGQVGHLAGLMNLEDDDRYYVVGMIVGFPIQSTKDRRITRWMHSVLIDYWMKGNGNEFTNRLGLPQKAN